MTITCLTTHLAGPIQELQQGDLLGGDESEGRCRRHSGNGPSISETRTNTATSPINLSVEILEDCRDEPEQREMEGPGLWRALCNPFVGATGAGRRLHQTPRVAALGTSEMLMAAVVS